MLSQTRLGFDETLSGEHWTRRAIQCDVYCSALEALKHFGHAGRGHVRLFGQTRDPLPAHLQPQCYTSFLQYCCAVALYHTVIPYAGLTAQADISSR